MLIIGVVQHPVKLFVEVVSITFLTIIKMGV
jgi:hypothetical protein